MVKKIRQKFELLKNKKRHTFDDLDSVIRRCLNDYGHLFPNWRVNPNGSRFVYHFNVESLSPISLEKEHGSREFVPHYYAKLAINGIDDLITYIEATVDMESAGSQSDDRDDDSEG